MAYRGPALQYKIRKTTVNNKTGDNFSITIPRFIANQFSGCNFSLTITEEAIIFTSGCKITSQEITNPKEYKKKIFLEGGPITFN